MIPQHPIVKALTGLVVGVIVLALVTALLVAANSSTKAVKNIGDAVARIETVQHDQKAQKRADREREASDAKARANLTHDNDVLQYQIRVQQEYIKTLIRAIRASGITVPPPPIAARSGETRPKAPRRTNPATPTPTGPTPRSPEPPLYCRILPQLCGFPLSVPTLLPF